MPPIRVRCPHCRNTLQFTSKKLDEREANVSAREAEVQRREDALRLREAEHANDVRLIRGCLHPDRHPEQADRYNRALQAFNRFLEQPTEASRVRFDFDDDIPF
jgi:hypothetical protein